MEPWCQPLLLLLVTEIEMCGHDNTCVLCGDSEAKGRAVE